MASHTDLEDDVEAKGDDQSHRDPQTGHAHVAEHAPGGGEVGLALEAEDGHRDEADHEAGEDHHLVKLEPPRGQHHPQRHQQYATRPLPVCGGRGIDFSFKKYSYFTQEPDSAENKDDERLDEQNKLRKLPADCEENSGHEYCEGQCAAWTRPPQILADEEKLQKYKRQREVFP